MQGQQFQSKIIIIINSVRSCFTPISQTDQCQAAADTKLMKSLSLNQVTLHVVQCNFTTFQPQEIMTNGYLLHFSCCVLFPPACVWHRFPFIDTADSIRTINLTHNVS